MSHLFTPLTVRGVTMPNRVWVSPMCMYSADNGVVGQWHVVHLGAFAAGSAGLVFAEATAVLPEGRITVGCPGIWNDEQAEAWRPVVDFVHSLSTPIGIQLAHAGRKGSCLKPWDDHMFAAPQEGGWETVAPSGIAFGRYPTPHALSAAEVRGVIDGFVSAAKRSIAVGFDVIEIHAAHGYLLHQFLSPLSNHRADPYGGGLEGRSRFLREAVAAVRREWPERLPLLVRLSATDWAEGGWAIDEAVELCRQLATLGVDLVDVSSGGLIPNAVPPVGPGYQAAFAERIRREAGLKTGAVGLLTTPEQAEHVVRSGQADLVLLGRALLRDPYFALRAASRLGHEGPWPRQYLRAKP